MKSVNSSINPIEQIESTDVFNSLYILKLRNAPTKEFTVNFNEDRIDLICNSIYGQNSSGYVPILILLNKKSTFKKGEVIKYIDSLTLRNL